jgi:predicted HAD superfamily hydrolase
MRGVDQFRNTFLKIKDMKERQSRPLRRAQSVEAFLITARNLTVMDNLFTIRIIQDFKGSCKNTFIKAEVIDIFLDENFPRIRNAGGAFLHISTHEG